MNELREIIQEAVDKTAHQYWHAIELAIKHSLRRAALWDGKEDVAALFERLDPGWRPTLETFPDGSARVLIKGEIMSIVEGPTAVHLPGHSYCDAARARGL